MNALQRVTLAKVILAAAQQGYAMGRLHGMGLTDVQVMRKLIEMDYSPEIVTKGVLLDQATLEREWDALHEAIDDGEKAAKSMHTYLTNLANELADLFELDDSTEVIA